MTVSGVAVALSNRWRSEQAPREARSGAGNSVRGNGVITLALGSVGSVQAGGRQRQVAAGR